MHRRHKFIDVEASVKPRMQFDLHKTDKQFVEDFGGGRGCEVEQDARGNLGDKRWNHLIAQEIIELLHFGNVGRLFLLKS